MPKFACETTARRTVMVINILFFIFGIVIVAVGIVGYQKAQEIQEQSAVMSQFDITVLTTIIFVSGIGTLIACILGFTGAYYRHIGLLKVYSVVVFLVVGIQLSIGAYLTTLNVNDLREIWELDNKDLYGLHRRQEFQNYLNCCGFDEWTDAIGPLATDCPFMPTTTNTEAPPSCKQAAQDYIKEWIAPVAAAAVTIAVLEIVALCTTCFIIYKTRGTKGYDTFDY